MKSVSSTIQSFSRQDNNFYPVTEIYIRDLINNHCEILFRWTLEIVNDIKDIQT